VSRRHYDVGFKQLHSLVAHRQLQTIRKDSGGKDERIDRRRSFMVPALDRRLEALEQSRCSR
jgi:hypothetical protein